MSKPSTIFQRLSESRSLPTHSLDSVPVDVHALGMLIGERLEISETDFDGVSLEVGPELIRIGLSSRSPAKLESLKLQLFALPQVRELFALQETFRFPTPSFTGTPTEQSIDFRAVGVGEVPPLFSADIDLSDLLPEESSLPTGDSAADLNFLSLVAEKRRSSAEVQKDRRDAIANAKRSHVYKPWMDRANPETIMRVVNRADAKGVSKTAHIIGKAAVAGAAVAGALASGFAAKKTGSGPKTSRAFGAIGGYASYAAAQDARDSVLGKKYRKDREKRRKERKHENLEEAPVYLTPADLSSIFPLKIAENMEISEQEFSDLTSYMNSVPGESDLDFLAEVATFLGFEFSPDFTNAEWGGILEYMYDYPGDDLVADSLEALDEAAKKRRTSAEVKKAREASIDRAKAAKVYKPWMDTASPEQIDDVVSGKKVYQKSSLSSRAIGSTTVGFAGLVGAEIARKYASKAGVAYVSANYGARTLSSQKVLRSAGLIAAATVLGGFLAYKVAQKVRDTLSPKAKTVTKYSDAKESVVYPPSEFELLVPQALLEKLKSPEEMSDADYDSLKAFMESVPTGDDLAQLQIAAKKMGFEGSADWTISKWGDAFSDSSPTSESTPPGGGRSGKVLERRTPSETEAARMRAISSAKSSKVYKPWMDTASPEQIQKVVNNASKPGRTFQGREEKPSAEDEISGKAGAAVAAASSALGAVEFGKGVVDGAEKVKDAAKKVKSAAAARAAARAAAAHGGDVPVPSAGMLSGAAGAVRSGGSSALAVARKSKSRLSPKVGAFLGAIRPKTPAQMAAAGAVAAALIGYGAYRAYKYHKAKKAADSKKNESLDLLLLEASKSSPDLESALDIVPKGAKLKGLVAQARALGVTPVDGWTMLQWGEALTSAIEKKGKVTESADSSITMNDYTVDPQLEERFIDLLETSGNANLPLSFMVDDEEDFVRIPNFSDFESLPESVKSLIEEIAGEMGTLMEVREGSEGSLDIYFSASDDAEFGEEISEGARVELKKKIRFVGPAIRRVVKHGKRVLMGRRRIATPAQKRASRMNARKARLRSVTSVAKLNSKKSRLRMGSGGTFSTGGKHGMSEASLAESRRGTPMPEDRPYRVLKGSVEGAGLVLDEAVTFSTAGDDDIIQVTVASSDGSPIYERDIPRPIISNIRSYIESKGYVIQDQQDTEVSADEGYYIVTGVDESRINFNESLGIFESENFDPETEGDFIGTFTANKDGKPLLGAEAEIFVMEEAPVFAKYIYLVEDADTSEGEVFMISSTKLSDEEITSYCESAEEGFSKVSQIVYEDGDYSPEPDEHLDERIRFRGPRRRIVIRHGKRKILGRKRIATIAQKRASRINARRATRKSHTAHAQMNARRSRRRLGIGEEAPAPSAPSRPHSRGREEVRQTPLTSLQFARAEQVARTLGESVRISHSGNLSRVQVMEKSPSALRLVENAFKGSGLYLSPSRGRLAEFDISPTPMQYTDPWPTSDGVDSNPGADYASSMDDAGTDSGFDGTFEDFMDEVDSLCQQYLGSSFEELGVADEDDVRESFEEGDDPEDFVEDLADDNDLEWMDSDSVTTDEDDYTSESRRRSSRSLPPVRENRSAPSPSRRALPPSRRR